MSWQIRTRWAGIALCLGFLVFSTAAVGFELRRVCEPDATMSRLAVMSPAEDLVRDQIANSSVCEEVTNSLKRAVKAYRNIVACLPVGAGNSGRQDQFGPDWSHKRMSVLTVGNSAGLTLALKTAQAGDTILLAPGTYTGLSLKDLSFSQNVTITSKDASDLAVLKDFKLDAVKGLTFKNLEFDNSGSGKLVGSFEAWNSHNLVFDKLHIHGALDGDPTNEVDALRFVGGSNISVTNSEFEQLKSGIGVKGVDGLKISGNNFHDLRLDGMRITGSSNVEVSKNSFTDFYHLPGDHSDAIQLYKTAGLTQDNIVIADNVIVQGKGAVMQGVYFGSENDIPYNNVKITGNLVIEGNYNAISIGGMKNLLIENNVVVGAPDQNNWIRVIDVEGVVSRNNEAMNIGFRDVTNLVQSGNQITAIPKDGGLAAYKAWLADHPGFVVSPEVAAQFGAVTAPPTPPVTAPPVVTPPAPTLPAAPVETAPVQPAPPVTTPIEAPATIEKPSWLPAEMTTANATTLLKTTVLNVTVTGANAIDVIGNAGNNIMIGNDARNQLLGMAGDDDLRGMGGNDFVRGDAGNDKISGDNGDDQLLGSAGNDTAWGGDGRDTVGGDDGDDMLYGDLGDDVLNGNAGADKVFGGAGNDQALGGQGNDTIWGEAGNDYVSGDQGADVLYGGAGADTFYMSKGFGVDQVMDFSAAEGDKIKVSGSYTVAQVGEDTVVTLGGADKMVLVGVDMASLKAGWIFAG